MSEPSRKVDFSDEEMLAILRDGARTLGRQTQQKEQG